MKKDYYMEIDMILSVQNIIRKNTQNWFKSILDSIYSKALQLLNSIKIVKVTFFNSFQSAIKIVKLQSLIRTNIFRILK